MKQVIVVRKDLKMSRGKIISQASHCSMAFILEFIKQNKPLCQKTLKWLETGHTKICVYTDTEEELLAIYKNAKEKEIYSHLILDEGRTHFDNIPTNTVICLGPDTDERIDPLTKHLKLL